MLYMFTNSLVKKAEANLNRDKKLDALEPLNSHYCIVIIRKQDLSPRRLTDLLPFKKYCKIETCVSDLN